MTFEIVRISIKNRDLMSHVAEDVFDYEISQQLLEQLCAQPTHFMAVAALDGQVVGQIRAMLHFNPDEPPILYFDNLGVTPLHKRKGIARALFADCLKWGKEKGVKNYWVATELDNEEANGFYQSLRLSGQKMIYYEGEL